MSALSRDEGLAWLVEDGIGMAFPIDSVERIAAEAPPEEGLVHAASWLGVTADPERRRFVAIRYRDHARWLEVSGSIHVLRATEVEVMRAPRLVREHLANLGATALVKRAADMGYLFSPRLFIERSSTP